MCSKSGATREPEGFCELRLQQLSQTSTFGPPQGTANDSPAHEGWPEPQMPWLMAWLSQRTTWISHEGTAERAGLRGLGLRGAFLQPAADRDTQHLAGTINPWPPPGNTMGGLSSPPILQESAPRVGTSEVSQAQLHLWLRLGEPSARVHQHP